MVRWLKAVLMHHTSYLASVSPHYCCSREDVCCYSNSTFHLRLEYFSCVSQLLLCVLTQLPDLVTELGVLYHMIESRVKMFHKLTKLHGKLSLLMTHVSDHSLLFPLIVFFAICYVTI